MPPSASSNRPSFCLIAPVNAPFSCPNSSLSSSVSVSAPQLTLMNGPAARFFDHPETCGREVMAKARDMLVREIAGGLWRL